MLLIILSLLLEFSKSIGELKENNPISKLISMVNMEIIDKSMQDLPRRIEFDFLQMVSKMINVKKEYSLNEAESAYLVFKWISENIKIDYYDEDSDDPIKAYNSGKDGSKSLSSLFNKFSYYLKVASDSISGYLKYGNMRMQFKAIKIILGIMLKLKENIIY